jgi:hypothetical protein
VSAQPETSPRGVRGGHFLFDLYEEDGPPIWGRGSEIIWPEGEPFMLAGNQGVGKSTLAQQLVLARMGVRPSEFLGYPVRPVRRGYKVLYLAMDRPRQIARSFRRMVTEKDRNLLNRRLVVWRGPLSHLNVAKDPFALAQWIDESHPKVCDVVVDSLKDLAVGLNSDDVGAAVNSALQELVATNRDVLVLHHNRKGQVGNKNPNKLDDVYGSNWLTAGCGSVAFISGDPGSPAVEFRHLKQPADIVGPLDILHEHSRGISRASDAKLDVLGAVSAKGKDGASLSEIALTVYHANGKAEQARARRRLDKLVAEGVVQHEQGAAGGKGGGATKRGRWFPVQP